MAGGDTHKVKCKYHGKILSGGIHHLKHIEAMSRFKNSDSGINSLGPESQSVLTDCEFLFFSFLFEFSLPFSFINKRHRDRDREKEKGGKGERRGKEEKKKRIKEGNVHGRWQRRQEPTAARSDFVDA